MRPARRVGAGALADTGDVTLARRHHQRRRSTDAASCGHSLHLYIADDRDSLGDPKGNHMPATLTILNFPVNDLGSAADRPAARGIRFGR